MAKRMFWFQLIEVAQNKIKGMLNATKGQPMLKIKEGSKFTSTLYT
jgi:hypothetical protein